VSRSFTIVAVGAVCVGALAAAITLPALVLGGRDAAPAGLPLATSGTRTVVQAAPVPTAASRPASHEPSVAPGVSPSLANHVAVLLAAPVSRPVASTPARPAKPEHHRAAPKPKPVAPKPTEPQRSLT
jgi:hypothetical protein